MSIKILHCAMMARPFVGIVNQMRWEHSAARNMGLLWDVKIFCPENLDFTGHIPISLVRIKNTPRLNKLINWIWIRLQYYKWIIKSHRHYDAILLRYSSYDPFQLLLSLVLREKLFTVHHTLEVVELKSFKSLTSSIQSRVEAILGSMTLSLVKGVVGVTNEIAMHERSRAIKANKKPFFVYPNGIYYGECSKVELASTRLKSPQPRLLFVASKFYPWQGLDLLLESISKSKEDFLLHIVGTVDDHLLETTNDSRIIFHGMLDSLQIEVLAEQCTVGIATLALHRNGMNAACPLKVREYLNSGLPVYGGYLDVFPKDFPYFTSGPANIENIVAYSRSISDATREEIAHASRPYIEKELLLNKLHEEISKIQATQSTSTGCGNNGRDY